MSPTVPVVAFGKSEESFYIGCGLRYYAPNVSPLLSKRAGGELPAVAMRWLSMDPAGEVWAARNTYDGTNYWDTRAPPDLAASLKDGTTEYATFGPSGSYYAGMEKVGQWTGGMTQPQQEGVAELVAQTADFKDTISGIIFGKGATMIFLQEDAFSFFTDKEAEGGLMEKVLMEYFLKRQQGQNYTIERGSCLSSYNVDYFYLKFKNPTDGSIEMRFNLPELMNTKFYELRNLALTPEENAEIMNYHNMCMKNARDLQQMAFATATTINNINSRPSSFARIYY